MGLAKLLFLLGCLLSHYDKVIITTVLYYCYCVVYDETEFCFHSEERIVTSFLFLPCNVHC